MTATRTRNRTRLSASALTALLLLGAPALAACGGVAEQAIEEAAEQAVEGAGGGDVELTDEGVTVTDDEGNEVAIGQDVALPDNWPAEVPPFEGGTLSMVTVQADGSASAMWSTDGTPEEAAQAYGGALEAAGYTSESNSNLGGMFVSEYSGNGYSVGVNVLDADGMATVMVTATKSG
jgi:hypothetical protein